MGHKSYLYPRMEVQNGTELCRKYTKELYNTVQNNTIHHGSVQCRTIQYSMLRHSAMKYCMVRYSVFYHGIAQFKTVECGAAQKTNMRRVV